MADEDGRRGSIRPPSSKIEGDDTLLSTKTLNSMLIAIHRSALNKVMNRESLIELSRGTRLTTVNGQRNGVDNIQRAGLRI